jgi:hypothetical protein
MSDYLKDPWDAALPKREPEPTVGTLEPRPMPFPVGLWGDDAIVQQILTDWIKAIGAARFDDLSAVRHIQRIPSETVQDVQAHELHTNAIGRLEDRIGRLEGYAAKLARRVEELERRAGLTVSIDYTA